MNVKRQTRKEALQAFGRPISAKSLRAHYARARDRQDRERRLVEAMQRFAEMGFVVIDEQTH
jgi:hypothetical protein